MTAALDVFIIGTIGVFLGMTVLYFSIRLISLVVPHLIKKEDK